MGLSWHGQLLTSVLVTFFSLCKTKCMHVSVPMCAWMEGKHGCKYTLRLKMQKSAMPISFFYIWDTTSKLSFYMPQERNTEKLKWDLFFHIPCKHTLVAIHLKSALEEWGFEIKPDLEQGGSDFPLVCLADGNGGLWSWWETQGVACPGIWKHWGPILTVARRWGSTSTILCFLGSDNQFGALRPLNSQFTM